MALFLIAVIGSSLRYPWRGEPVSSASMTLAIDRTQRSADRLSCSTRRSLIPISCCASSATSSSSEFVGHKLLRRR